MKIQCSCPSKGDQASQGSDAVETQGYGVGGHFKRGKFTSEEANMSQQGGNSQATQSQIGDIMRVGSEKGDS